MRCVRSRPPPVSAASAAPHTACGAVSRQLKLLEDHLGLALFQRAGRGLRLTAAGTRLQAACSEPSAASKTACANCGGRRRPALVLGCSGSVLARWMIPRLPALQAALPGVRLQWSALDGSFTEAQAALDSVLLLAQGPWPRGWQVRELAPERVGVVVAPRIRPRSLRHVPPSALLQETLLHQLTAAGVAGVGAGALWTPRSCSWARPSSICTTCWRQRWPGWARRSHPSHWWPRTWPPDDWSRRGVCRHWWFLVLAQPDGPPDARVDALADWLGQQLR